MSERIAGAASAPQPPFQRSDYAPLPGGEFRSTLNCIYHYTKFSRVAGDAEYAPSTSTATWDYVAEGG